MLRKSVMIEWSIHLRGNLGRKHRLQGILSSIQVKSLRLSQRSSLLIKWMALKQKRSKVRIVLLCIRTPLTSAHYQREHNKRASSRTPCSIKTQNISTISSRSSKWSMRMLLPTRRTNSKSRAVISPRISLLWSKRSSGRGCSYALKETVKNSSSFQRTRCKNNKNEVSRPQMLLLI